MGIYILTLKQVFKTLMKVMYTMKGFLFNVNVIIDNYWMRLSIIS